MTPFNPHLVQTSYKYDPIGESTGTHMGFNPEDGGDGGRGMRVPSRE